MSLELVVRCDGCDRAGDSKTKGYAYILRKNLRKQGGHYVNGKDMCPACWLEKQKEK